MFVYMLVKKKKKNAYFFWLLVCACLPVDLCLLGLCVYLHMCVCVCVCWEPCHSQCLICEGRMTAAEETFMHGGHVSSLYLATRADLCSCVCLFMCVCVVLCVCNSVFVLG